MTPADLASRRWFRSKQRSIAAVPRSTASPIGPGALVVLEVGVRDDGGSERYLVPLVDGREPADGEGLWTALAEAIGREARIGRFVDAPRGRLRARSPWASGDSPSSSRTPRSCSASD